MFFHWLKHLATGSKCLISKSIKLTFVRRQVLKNTNVGVTLRQNEQHEQIEFMANDGPLSKGIENDTGNILESELWNTVNV